MMNNVEKQQARMRILDKLKQKGMPVSGTGSQKVAEATSNDPLRSPSVSTSEESETLNDMGLSPGTEESMMKAGDSAGKKKKKEQRPVSDLVENIKAILGK